MKKVRWLLILIVLNFMFVLLTSCKTHVHTFADAWIYDEQMHWQGATCEHPDEKRSIANHIFTEWVEVVPATEEQTGLKKRSCTVCYYEESAILPKLSHDYGEWEVVKSPSMEETGMIVQICKRSDADINAVILPKLSAKNYTISHQKLPSCLEQGIDEYIYYQGEQKLSFEVMVDALGHDLIHSESKNPTCIDDGYQEYDSCSRCDYTTYEAVENLGHNFGFWKVEKKPTLSEGGALLRICGRDTSHTEKLNLPALNDTNYTLEHTKPSTCTEEGIDTYRFQKDGQEFEFEQMLPVLGHDLVHHEAADATCDQVGNPAYDSCSRCDYTTYEEITALGHNLVHHEELNPTCDNIGYDAYDSCTRCDYTTYEEIAALGHNYKDWMIQTFPTETTFGSAIKTCTRQNEHKLELELPPLTEKDYEIHHQKEATYLEDGLDTYIYEKNDEVISIEIILPALGHDYGPWEAVKEDVSGSTITLKRVCKRDPLHIELLTVEVNKIEHSILPTCLEDGLDIYRCLVNGEISNFDVVVPSLGHDIIHHKAQLPACEMAGCESYDSCSRCDYQTEMVEVEPLGHLYGQWSIDTNPTATTEGLCIQKCQYDLNHVIQQPLPKLNLEDYTLTHTIKPKCVSTGLDDYSYEIDGQTLHVEVIVSELGHDLVAHNAVDPTCERIGNHPFDTCSRCNYSTYQEIPALGHSYGVWEVTTEPTLKQMGSLMKTCIHDESHHLYDNLPALNEQEYEKKTLLEPDCLEAGVDTYVYTKDRQVFTFAVVVSALKHQYQSWSVAVTPTLTSAGKISRVCSRDSSHTDVLTLPALNDYQYSLNHLVPAKCLEYGKDVYTYYRDYQEFRFEIKSSPLGHHLVHHEESEPTCEEEGGTDYDACSRCDYKTDHGVVPALGHTYDQTGYCQRCSKVYYRTKQLSDTECMVLSYEGSKDNTEIFIPQTIDGLKVVAIEPGIFSSLTSITTLDLAFVGSSIGSGYLGELFGATSYLNQNEVIPSTLTEVMVGGKQVSEGAFYGCSHIRKLTIKDTVQYIGISILTGCQSLEELSVPFIGRMDNDDTYTYLGYFYGVTNYTWQESVVYASLQKVSVTNTTTLGAYAFYQCHELKEVVLTDQITLIDVRAFYGCSGLTQLALPHQLVIIKDSAFERTGLKSVVIPDSVVSVAASIFANCSQLEEVVFGKRTTKILSFQFLNCKNLTKVTLTENISVIADYSFSGCSSLEALVIPSSVNLMGVSVFNDCNSLTIYCASEERPAQWSENFNPLNRPVYWGYRENSMVDLDDYHYIIQQDAAVMVGYSGQLTQIAVPATIEVDSKVYPVQIGAYAFENSLLTSITLAEGITEIGAYAFTNSLALTEVNIPSTVSSIPRNCFDGCSVLSMALVPGIKTIGEEAFANCSSLQDLSLPEGLTFIDARAFYHCSSLVEIQLPNSLTSVGSAIFSGASGLKKVVFGSGLTRISNFMFEYCHSLSVVNLPENIKEIGVSAFNYCSSLESIYLPSTITTMGFNVFNSCSKLIIFSKYQSAPTEGWNAEWNRYNRPVYWGKTLDDVFNYGDFDCILYQDAVVLVKYRASNSVQGVLGTINRNGTDYPVWIGDYCFAGSAVERVSLNEGVKHIGDYAFSQCKNLSKIDFSSDLNHIGQSAFYNTNLQDVTLPSGIVELPWRAFANCTSLTTVTLNSGLEIIGEDAFAECKALTSIDIPKTVHTIGEDAFTGCNHMRTLDIPKTVTTIGFHAFSACEQLIIFCGALSPQEKWDGQWNPSTRPVYFGQSANNIEIINGLNYIVNNDVNDEKAILVLYNGIAAEVEVPAQVTINGINYNVSIGNSSFENTDVTKVMIQDGIQDLGSSVFSRCDLLEEVQIPTNLTSIKSKTFADCSALKTIKLPSTITTIGKQAFYCCSSLTELSLPEGLEFIGDEAFYSSGLVNCSLPNSLVVLGKRVFASCKELISVTLGTGIKLIPQETFYQCQKLASIIIPENIETIESSAFGTCTSLTYIIIPLNVLSIDSYAFSYCDQLTIFCEVSAKPSAWNRFWNSSNRPVYWYLEKTPDRIGNYWHYVNSEIKIWSMIL